MNVDKMRKNKNTPESRGKNPTNGIKLKMMTSPCDYNGIDKERTTIKKFFFVKDSLHPPFVVRTVPRELQGILMEYELKELIHVF